MDTLYLWIYIWGNPIVSVSSLGTPVVIFFPFLAGGGLLIQAEQ